MKKFCVILSIVAIFVMLIFGTTYKQTNKDYLRIHIRANSNAQVDQIVKYEIKDKVVNLMTPLVANCESFEQVKECFENSLSDIDNVCNTILKSKGYSYVAKSKLAVEEFPTRSYNGFVLENGFYDAVIVELGEAKGDNWWCVLYPPLCFTNACTGSNVVYKSRILDLINSFKK